MSKISNWWRRSSRKVRAKWLALKAPGKFLCDSCRYDYRSACTRPERPNATSCEDYEPR